MSTLSRPRTCRSTSLRKLPLLARAENVTDGRGEITQARAGNDDRVPATVSFLGNAQKSATLVLAEFEMKPLSFDLNFFRFENAVHLETFMSLERSAEELEANSAWCRGRKLFDGSRF